MTTLVPSPADVAVMAAVLKVYHAHPPTGGQLVLTTTLYDHLADVLTRWPHWFDDGTPDLSSVAGTLATKSRKPIVWRDIDVVRER